MNRYENRNDHDNNVRLTVIPAPRTDSLFRGWGVRF